jgi:transposase
VEEAVAKRTAPEILTLSATELEELLVKLAALLPAELYQLVQKLMRTLQWVMGVLEARDTTIGRLARLIFGAKTEKTKQVFPPPPPTGNPNAAAQSASAPPKRKGHGRMAAAAYTGAKRVRVVHPQLRVGDACPDCKQGKLYGLKQPGQIVRITAQPPIAATCFELERLRCKLCGKVFTAPAPPEAGLGKYDPEVGSTLGYLRFGGGVPRAPDITKRCCVCQEVWDLRHVAGDGLFESARCPRSQAPTVRPHASLGQRPRNG